MAAKIVASATAGLAVLAAAALPGLIPVTAVAQTHHWVAPPNRAPTAPRADNAHNLDFLFEALKAAPDEDTAQHIENRIWALWLVSGSDTVDLLMNRVTEAIDTNDVDLALQLLDAVIELKPDYVEGWNRRATLYFSKKDYGRAVADIGEVLKREPRHFGALIGLGVIMQEIGDDKHALETFRRALAINPHLQKVPDLVKSLSEKVEGRDL
jgi:tetratricopeptide (TPR) repeat protein